MDREADVRVVRHSLVPAAIHGMVFLAGLWLALSPSIPDIGGNESGSSGYWNERVAGAALIFCGAASLLELAEYQIWRPVQSVTGLWLLGTPFFLSYHSGGAESDVAIVDMVVGTIVLGLSFLAWKIPRWSPPVRVRRQRSWTC
ncbi:SPW repeat domain-containing protein [Amycolatopsis sp. TRM77291]